jgi:hypothetical protein
LVLEYFPFSVDHGDADDIDFFLTTITVDVSDHTKRKGRRRIGRVGSGSLSVSNRTEKGDETSKNGGLSDRTSQRLVSSMEFGEDKISINERRKKLSPRKEKERKKENLLTRGQVMLDESE